MRPKSVPELRGMPTIPRDRERPYSPESYAAQYGIDLEEAEHLVDNSISHPQIHRQIIAMLQSDADLKERALFLSEEDEPTDDEKSQADRLLKRAGLQPIYGGLKA